jgi:hypothetical protein
MKMPAKWRAATQCVVNIDNDNTHTLIKSISGRHVLALGKSARLVV